MANFCACNGTILNTGTPNKQRVISSGVKLFVVPMKADDGSANGILNTDTIDQAYLDAKINNPDPSKRWYPIGEFKNQEDVRADPITESFSDGSSAVTQQGVRTYTGWLINYSPKYIENLDSFSCQNFGIYSVDKCGGLTGSESKDGTILYPTRVNNNSWNPTLVKATPTVSAKVQLTFEYSQTEKDEYLRVISDSEITADLLDAEGLLEVAGKSSSVTTDGFVTDLRVDYDEFLEASKTVVPGWVITDFKLENITQGTTITITSVTEGPDGTYTFVIPTQTAADELNLTNDLAVKQGFNLDQTIIIP